VHNDREATVGANEDIVRQGYDAFGAGDMETLSSLMSPDVVHSVPGNNLISGEHKGIDNVLGFYGKMFELTDGKMSVTLKTVTEKGADHAIAVHQGAAERGTKKLDSEGTLDFTINDGKIARIDESNPDQAAEDDFWS